MVKETNPSTHIPQHLNEEPSGIIAIVSSHVNKYNAVFQHVQRDGLFYVFGLLLNGFAGWCVAPRRLISVLR
jgi:hypothetical protein